MSNSLNYDSIDYLFSPPPYMSHHLHNGTDSPNPFDTGSGGTSSSSDPSSNSSNGSSSQSTGHSPNFPIDEIGISFNDLQTANLPLITEPTATLQILAQPKASYRERYCSETDTRKYRAQRFIRVNDGTNRYEYPTVQIPPEWRDHNRDLYIRVTLVTIVSEVAPVICVHPYAIDTQENDILKDSPNNSLYFPIISENIVNGQKSFRISRKKMTQHDLRSYGRFRLLNSDQYDIERVINSYDAKQIIETYQLWKSQLLFTIAERFNNSGLPLAMYQTSVTSQTMCDEGNGRRKDSLSNTTPACTSTPNEDVTICAPSRGNWQGGDNILMVIPKLDRRKLFNIYFDYGSMEVSSKIQVTLVDSKTISFQTPPCLMSMSEQNLIVPIIVTQNESIIARVDFLYLTSMNVTTSQCSQCQFDMNHNNRTSNKRRHFVSEPPEIDGGELVIEQISQLTIQKPSELHPKLNTNESNSKFDKYLGQLQEAVVTFVRTSNPARLFRRTRLLLAKCDENPPPLDDAIRHGHLEIALRLIEQVLDVSGPNDLLVRENSDGEIPLLLAAKLNKWNLIELMLTKRPDLAKKTDKHGNTILHLLAGVTDDAARVTIENVLQILPVESRKHLLGKVNESKQLAIDIAHDKNNTQCIDLLKASEVF